MYRYISLIWNEADQQASENAKFLKSHFQGTATAWEPTYEGRGLLVLHTGEEKNRMQAYPLNTLEGHSGGVILGKLHPRERTLGVIAGNADLNTGEARNVIQTAGRHLVDDYWGTYVAFFQDGPRKYVQVDPIGLFSCFSISYRGVEIYFTYLPDVASCEFLKLSVDWTTLAHGLYDRMDQTKVPLNEVTKIQSGECLTITDQETTKTTYWNPQKISQTDVIEDVETAAQTLRETILSTVAAMAAPYDNVMEQLGGLDSSIMLAALGKVPTPLKVTAINIRMDDHTMDERYFVRQTTAHMGVPLVDAMRDAERLDFDEISAIPLTTLPGEFTFMPGMRKLYLDRYRKCGAQAMFNGTGGDEILYHSGQNFPAIDYIKTHGIGLELLRIIMEISRMKNKSVWAILPGIIRGGFGTSRFESTSIKPTGLLTTAFQDSFVAAPCHPWMTFRDGVTPGKLDHISPLTHGTYVRENESAPEDFYETLYPYLSQPVIEACLRIPLWRMLVDGKNRGMARKAFKDQLPPEVIWRWSKMIGGKTLKAFFRDNIDRLEGLLLDGELVRANILDRPNLEKILREEHDIEAGDFFSLNGYLSAELWARKVQGDGLMAFVRSEVA